MISTATPRTIAGKIAAAHNHHECRFCQRELPAEGVLAVGLSGSDARYYPDAETAERHTTGIRYVFPYQRDRDVEINDVLAFLEQQRDEIELRVEELERERDQRRLARLAREDDSGFRTDPFPCADCGYPKHRPADRCDRCGDEPCSLALDPHGYNRGYGYRD